MSIIIWSKNGCGYCEAAKNLLAQRGLEFEERKIDGVTWTREQLLEAVPDALTVPQILIDGKLIGGFTQLKETI
jgi:glutaredoxin 3